ncbi:RlpA-like double-psi beta-barrel-protein domain-containing protein-containing protein [Aspergillus unguis]
MKYQRLASLALAALSASTAAAAPLKQEENGSCPAGYSPSVYYVTVTAEATPVVAAAAASLTSATSESTSLASISSSVTSTSTSTSTTLTTSTQETSSATTSEAAHSTAGIIETIPAAFLEQSTTSSATASTTSSTEVSDASISEAPTTQAAVVQSASTTTSTATSTSASSTSTDTSKSSGSSSSSGTSTSGTATFYGGNLSGGTCSFTDYTIPSGLYGVAYSGQAWDNAAECGACFSVTGPNGDSVKVMVVDECPECSSTHFDLFENAFTTLSEKSAGEISISYTPTSCGISSPLILHNKSGTSAYWFSMQVVNANEAVKSLEVSTDGGSTWQETQRSEYNFFENSSGFGTEKVDVRVTGVSGGKVVVKDVPVDSDSSTTADGNV